MFSVMACTPGNTEAECIAYTEQFMDQMIAAHNNLMIHEYQILVLVLLIGLLLGFLLTYLIFHFSNM